MRFYEYIDEQGRFCGLLATKEEPNGEVMKTSTLSYARCRRDILLEKEIHNPRNLINYQVYVSVHV